MVYTVSDATDVSHDRQHMEDVYHRRRSPDRPSPEAVRHRVRASLWGGEELLYCVKAAGSADGSAASWRACGRRPVPPPPPQTPKEAPRADLWNRAHISRHRTAPRAMCPESPHGRESTEPSDRGLSLTLVIA